MGKSNLERASDVLMRMKLGAEAREKSVTDMNAVLLRRAAVLGHSVAQGLLEGLDDAEIARRHAVCHRKGCLWSTFLLAQHMVTEGRKDEGMALMREAAERGHPRAQAYLAAVLSGEDGERETPEASMPAGLAGGAGAVAKLGDLLRPRGGGDGHKAVLASMSASIESERLGELEVAYLFCERAAEPKTHAPALLRLGRMLRDGVGCAVDRRRAKEAFADAAVFDDPVAHLQLGLMHDEDLDRDDAMRSLASAVRLGNSDAMFHLGVMVISGQADPTDDSFDALMTRGAQFLEKAASCGHQLAQKVLDEFVPVDNDKLWRALLLGRIVPRHLSNAGAALRRIDLTQGDVRSAFRSILTFLTFKKPEVRSLSVRNLEKTADAGDDLSAFFYAMIVIDSPISFWYAARAAEHDFMPAVVLTGIFLELGLHDVPRDPARAASLYVHAGAHGLLRRLPASVVFSAYRQRPSVQDVLKGAV